MYLGGYRLNSLRISVCEQLDDLHCIPKEAVIKVKGVDTTMTYAYNKLEHLKKVLDAHFRRELEIILEILEADLSAEEYNELIDFMEKNRKPKAIDEVIRLSKGEIWKKNG